MLEKRTGAGEAVGHRMLLPAAVLLFAAALAAALTVAFPVSAAAEPVAGPFTHALTTTGPTPPSSVPAPASARTAIAGAGAVLLDVPAYLWRDGCSPTSLGMVLGYYDGRGFSDLVPGDASVQIANQAVDQMIASHGSPSSPRHYEDYALPLDEGGPILPDRSEAPAGDEHPSDSLADFMHTSWSADGLEYGWSWVSMLGPAFREYVALTVPGATTSFTDYWIGAFGSGELTFAVLKAEIDAGRPLVLYVDSSGDGVSDHAVAGVGYRETNGYPEYACLDTWYRTVRWSRFRVTAAGRAWGVAGGTVLRLTGAGTRDLVKPVSTVSGAPAGWSRTPVTLTFDATDEGSGVDRIEVDWGGAGWTALAGLPATLEVAGQGVHALAYRAVDRDGNVEAARTCTVRIDAKGPVTSARAALVRRGARVTLRYRVADLTPKANVRLVVRTLSGRARVTLRPGWRGTGVLRGAAWRATLPRGTYRVWVYATDQAGNRQRTAGSARLVVR